MFADLVDELNGLGDAGLATRLQDLERQRRTLEAELAATINTAARHGSFRADGHRSISGWVKALINCSGSEATHFVRLGELLHDIDECGDGLYDGEVGVAAMSEMARARRNPRCGDQLGEAAPLLLGHAQKRSFADFKECVKRWELITDPDGAFKDVEANNRARTANVFDSDGSLFVRASGGTAGVAAEMREIFERFCHAEFLTDWDHVVANHGNGAPLSLMERTDPQRRFDALAAIFRAAACAPLDARVPEPTVNIVVDQRTYEEHIARTFTGAGTTPLDGDIDSVDDPWERRCGTTNGTLVHPAEILSASIIGHVRRVVLDSAGNVIDLGRRRRLFTGAAREAVMLQANSCIWPGCEIAVGRCEADHLDPWNTSGTTTPSNGAPLCRHHNQTKNRGFITRRDPHGHWHVYRPDGTELTQPSLDQYAA